MTLPGFGSLSIERKAFELQILRSENRKLRLPPDNADDAEDVSIPKLSSDFILLFFLHKNVFEADIFFILQNRPFPSHCAPKAPSSSDQ